MQDKTEEEMVNLFVYGTLRRGQTYHYLLEGQRYLGEYSLKGYDLYSLGRYPAAVKSDNPDAFIKGEMYQVSKSFLRDVIDDLEEYKEGRKKNFYYRVMCEVSNGSKKFNAYMYHIPYSELLERYKRGGVLIEDGDWCKYVEERRKKGRRHKTRARR